MVSHLILLFGLLCAGAAAALDSWDYAEDLVETRSSDADWAGFRRTTYTCDECLETVTVIVNKANEAKKAGNYNKNFFPCPTLLPKLSKICEKVINFVKEPIAKDYMDKRGICVKAKFCAAGQSVNNSPAGPLAIFFSDSRASSDGLGKKGCQAKKRENQFEAPGPDGNNEPPLDSPRLDSKCRKCTTIIKGIRDFIGGNKPQLFMLPYACNQLQESNVDDCLQLIHSKSDEIIRLLTAKKTNIEICTSIGKCLKSFKYCPACSKYVYYNKITGFDDYNWELWACKNFREDERDQCQRQLRSNKSRIRELVNQNPNAKPYEICWKVQMCRPLLQVPELASVA